MKEPLRIANIALVGLDTVIGSVVNANLHIELAGMHLNSVKFGDGLNAAHLTGKGCKRACYTRSSLPHLLPSPRGWP